MQLYKHSPSSLEQIEPEGDGLQNLEHSFSHVSPYLLFDSHSKHFPVISLHKESLQFEEQLSHVLFSVK